ncbi:TPA: hypothetical protein JI248_07955 [Acinetobacter baumannii]|nr:hypothetical protein [Acinetobacter baumannii]
MKNSTEERGGLSSKISGYLFVILKESNPQKNLIFMKSGKIIEKYSTHLVLKRNKQLFLD